jgi:REP element-mobilizing transposase RayT
MPGIDQHMWNETDTPIAYFITFRCYGTWLHGDDRGSIDRHNNIYGTPKYPKIEHWNQITEDRLRHEPVKLDKRRRTIVERAIRNVCEKRGWHLHATNVRTNHAHSVVANPGKPSGIILNAFKANATREMREAGCWTSDRSPWADKGSQRRIWNETQLYYAIDYVLNGQGDDLPKFE